MITAIKVIVITMVIVLLAYIFADYITDNEGKRS
jgi:hypothetical protein